MKSAINSEITVSQMGLKEEQLEGIQRFARKHTGIEEVIVYGSRAMGITGGEVMLIWF